MGGIEPLTEAEAEAQAGLARALLAQLGRVVLGQSDVLEEAVLALMARGHVLFEGAPGTAKTLLVRTLAETLGLEFRRIQS